MLVLLMFEGAAAKTMLNVSDITIASVENVNFTVEMFEYVIFLNCCCQVCSLLM